MRELFAKIYKDKLTLTAVIILIILYLGIILADFLAPYDKHFADRNLSYAPPSNIYIINEKGKLSAPYTYNWVKTFDSKSLTINFYQDRSQKYYLKFFKNGKLLSLENGGKLFLLGTDINGRDNFSRILYGGRISLTIGFLALFITFPIGLIYGGISGYFGGKVDIIMMRLAEAIMSIPSFYLLIILASILPSSMTSAERFSLIVVLLAFIGWAGLARVVRGMVLSIKTEDYVKSAISLGASKFRIIMKHILPQTSSYVIVAITLLTPSYILSESGLSFLGLGIQQPDASWGNMLKEAQEFTNIISRPWLLTPGFLIFLAVLSFNILGDTIRDFLDPKNKN